MASTLQGNFATQIFVVHLFIDSHGCGRSRDVVYGVDIDQFEDLSQNIEVNSEKQGMKGDHTFPIATVFPSSRKVNRPS
jgi:hypothetical protein